MNEKRIVFITTISLIRHSRAFREVHTLIQNGYSLTSLCWDRRIVPVIENWEEGIGPKEIQLKLQAPLGIIAMPLWPLWHCFTFFWLMVTNWDAVHAMEINSLPGAILAGKLKRKPVVYDMPDVYEDSIRLPKFFRNILVSVDKLFIRMVECVILADDNQVEELNGIPNSMVVAIYDAPEDVYDNKVAVKQSRNDIFTLFYGGILTKSKKLNLDKLFLGIKDIDGVRVVIAGYGDLIDEINKWVNQMPEKIQYIGEVSRTEIFARTIEADLLFVLRSRDVIPYKYICGSKLLEAMMCGKPIIVNSGTSTANKVIKENCGIVVDANSPEEIKMAILTLKNNSKLCRELGANARKSFENKYGWNIMKQRLLNIYSQLTKDNMKG